MSLNNLSISRKLSFGFALVVMIELVMCVVVLSSLNSIRAATDANNVSSATLAAADAALSALVEQQNATRGYVATGDASFPKRIVTFQADFNKAADQMDAIAGDGPLKAKVDALRVEAAKVAGEEAEQMKLRGDPATLTQAQASILTRGRLTHSREILKSVTDPEHALLIERNKAQLAAIHSGQTAHGAGHGRHRGGDGAGQDEAEYGRQGHADHAADHHGHLAGTDRGELRLVALD